MQFIHQIQHHHRMVTMRALGGGLVVLLLVLESLSYAEPVGSPFSSVCPVNFVIDSILMPGTDSVCPLFRTESFDVVGVIEGDEVSLHRALNMVHKKTHDYVAVLFYASWCPFSKNFRPSFSIMSSLYPSIPHFAIEKSVISPSMLSKYGVHAFPTFILMNSTMRVCYHGSRTLDSLVAFYSDVTGIRTALVEGISLDRICSSSYYEKHDSEQETRSFSWVRRSPENVLQQDMYLTLASTFVLLRLLYFIFPSLRRVTRVGWRRCIVRLRSFWEYPMTYLNQAMQLFNSLKEPCKRSNLQEGAINAKLWASNSLAPVSFGDASTSRLVPPAS